MSNTCSAIKELTKHYLNKAAASRHPMGWPQPWTRQSPFKEKTCFTLLPSKTNKKTSDYIQSARNNCLKKNQLGQFLSCGLYVNATSASWEGDGQFAVLSIYQANLIKILCMHRALGEVLIFILITHYYIWIKCASNAKQQNRHWKVCHNVL